MGSADLGFGEAGVVFDEAAAVGVRAKEEARCFGERGGLGVFADSHVGDGGLLEVRDELAF